MTHHILVLGGSTFMGKSLLEYLSTHKDYDVHYVNRGRNHWSNSVKTIPNIHYTYGNRENKKDFQLILSYLSEKLDILPTNDKKWDVIIDFSAFRYKDIRVNKKNICIKSLFYFLWIKSVYLPLKGKTRLYIFISSDSIYDQCDTNSRKEAKILEDYDFRPEDAELKRKLIKNDIYGHVNLKLSLNLFCFKENSRIN